MTLARFSSYSLIAIAILWNTTGIAGGKKGSPISVEMTTYHALPASDTKNDSSEDVLPHVNHLEVGELREDTHEVLIAELELAQSHIFLKSVQSDDYRTITGWKQSEFLSYLKHQENTHEGVEPIRVKALMRLARFKMLANRYLNKYESFAYSSLMIRDFIETDAIVRTLEDNCVRTLENEEALQTVHSVRSMIPIIDDIIQSIHDYRPHPGANQKDRSCCTLGLF